MKHILTQLLTLIIAGIPFSLLVSNYFQKIFSKFNTKLANINTVCTKVIGTLTRDEISVKSLQYDKYKVKVDEESDFLEFYNQETKKTIKIEQRELKKDETVNFMAICATLCHYEKMRNIETVMSHFFQFCNISSSQIEHEYKIIDEIPCRKNKKISTVVTIKNTTQEIFSFSKGNPKAILEKCSRMLVSGNKIEIDYQLRRKLKRQIKSLNKRGEKVIAFAYKGLPLKRYDKYTESFAEKDMVLVGIVGLGNFIDKELSKQISELKNAGVKIRLLAKTRARKAIAVGQELGIVNPQYFESIEKDELEDLSDEKLAKMLANKEKDYVFSELREDDHNRIVNILKNKGENVIIANKREGFSIKTILERIQKGRQINANTKKIYSHALVCKITEVIMIITAIVVRAPLPLSIGLIITIDLIINLPLELALKHEPENNSKDINHTKLITIGVITGIIISGVYIWSLTRFGWYPGENITVQSEAFAQSASIAFILLIIFQLTNAYKIRRQKNIISNPYLPIVSILVLLLTYSMPKFNILNLGPIKNTIDFIIILFIIVLVLILDKASIKFLKNK